MPPWRPSSTRNGPPCSGAWPASSNERARAESLAATLDALPVADPDVLAEQRRAHAEAERWRWVLCVQREAIGLCDHRWIDAVYPAIRRR